MLGYDDEDIEPHVSAWERLLHPDDRSRADQLNERAARGDPTYEGEFRLRHKDGHYVNVLARISGSPRAGGTRGPDRRDALRFDGAAARRGGTGAHRDARALIFAQEDERRRIAREMHDQFGEQLTTPRPEDRRTQGGVPQPAELREQVDALEAVAQQLDRDVDQLVWALRPTALDDLGLRAAVANYVQDWSARVGIAAELHTSARRTAPVGSRNGALPIAQEALTNVARHSRARNVEVILERRPDWSCSSSKTMASGSILERRARRSRVLDCWACRSALCSWAPRWSSSHMSAKAPSWSGWRPEGDHA